MAYPPGPFIHQAWHDIVPPIYSLTHPSQIHPQANRIDLHRTLQPTSPTLPLTPPDSIDRFEDDFPPLRAGTPLRRSTPTVIYETGSSVARAKNGKGLDRFASSYTPQWLNQLPPPAFTFNLPPSPPFPPTAYAADIFPPKLLAEPLPITHQCPSILSTPPRSDSALPLQSDDVHADVKYYSGHFSHLLSLHLSGLMEDTHRSRLSSTVIQPYPIPGVPDTYRIYVPAVREDAPRLYVGG